ncbi:hypothetical protein [Gynuella sp.]|uniref:hypothetical protein n=1 Tax=Gynuella sp. TaxID=2969146 RepID=UPI003D0B00A9
MKPVYICPRQVEQCYGMGQAFVESDDALCCSIEPFGIYVLMFQLHQTRYSLSFIHTFNALSYLDRQKRNCPLSDYVTARCQDKSEVPHAFDVGAYLGWLEMSWPQLGPGLTATCFMSGYISGQVFRLGNL